MTEKQKILPEQAELPGKDGCPCAGCERRCCTPADYQKISDQIIDRLPEVLLSAMYDRFPADPGKSG